jgi:LPXTG-site transpeptidase (sortase) family protein
MVALIGLTLVLALLIYSVFNKSAQNGSIQEQTNLSALSLSGPVHLKIPKINVSATIESVGLTPDGAMDVPKGPADVAWFNQGVRPGEIGSAVISGHYGWKNGIPAVFDNLDRLNKGDKIYIEDEKGATTTFAVRESVIYGENQAATNVFSSSDGLAHLNLITCDGIWDGTKKSYSDRLVVFTDME